ncbi:MAG: urea transporter [Nitrospirae bacterium]|nr:urea transporter [Nitrospirota bacterium]
MTTFRQKRDSLTSLIRLISGSIPLSYSNIFFSNSRLLGILIIAATMLFPLHGITGILGALFSGSWAYLLGADRQSIKKGFYGFNGALTGLAAGYFYTMDMPLLLFLLLTTLFLTLLTIFLNNVFDQHFKLPALSMPFNITASMIMLAGAAISHLTPAENMPLINMQPPLPSDMDTFLSSFSAILFQPNPVSGLLIAAGILIYSRIAFTLMATGFLAAYYIHLFSGIDMNIINAKYLGFNYMFSSLAIGGVFAISGAGSFVLALLASAVTVIITAACVMLLPFPLSPLAIPFNLTVWLFLYALRFRIYPCLNINLSQNSVLSPEESLRKHHEILKQWKKSPITIALPFHGRWQVTQGIDGKVTHKEDWRFAYDFQAVDFNGRSYRSDGLELEDHYSFGLPVISPADGRVHSIKKDVHDNSIGKANTEENWGNYIIIEHAQNYYSCLAHLKKGSIKAAPGQDIKKGEIIAACGNSGRSPYPHIHMQFQVLPKAGAPSSSFEFSNVMTGDEGRTFIPQGNISESSIVQNMVPAADYEEFFPYSLNKIWTYKVTGGKNEKIEEWHTDLDFYGNTFLKSSPEEARLYFQLSGGVLSVKAIEGDDAAGLSLMGSFISEIPFTANDQEITWRSFEPADYGIPTVFKAAIDVLSLVGVSLMADRLYTAETINDEMMLNIRSSLSLKIPFMTFRLKELPVVDMVFKRKAGMKSLKIEGGKEIVLAP